MDKRTVFTGNSMFGCSGMKGSESELAIQEFFADAHHAAEIFGESEACDAFAASANGDRIPPPPKNEEIQSNSLADNTFWSQSLYSHQSKFPVSIDTVSSKCVDSPISANTSKGDNRAVGASSGSSHEQSDEEDPDIETGSWDQSTNPTETKRNRRKESNRESARRSRRKKQEHLTDLEQLVELLRGESDSLFKQLAAVTQQFKDSTTNNRVLRSNVEALRAKVKLAEDMVARGSLTSSLNHLLQNYLNTPHDYTNMDHTVSPIIPLSADHNSPYTGLALPKSTIGLDAFNEAVMPGELVAAIDAVDHVPETWTWESHSTSVSK